ncbi:MAG: FAD-dependent oxidoreductase [Verrucomicrobiaceae bacterium]|nr:FAD-dependent oxidoreductase [Verrucomicrobiaceae bacterium]
MTDDFDFLVLGGGSAGYAAARTAAAEGMRVAVVDGAEELGGLCILRGCMPSKALIESANRNLAIRRAEEFGLRVESRGVDVTAVRDRKRALIAGFAGYRQGQLQDGRFVLHRGHARFKNAHAVEITPREGGAGVEIRARTFCVAAGSVSNVPEIPGLREAGFWTSDDVLDAGSLPQSIAVLGGGAIALEMAHYLEGVGCKVALIQRGPQFLTGQDRACSEVIENAFTHRGIGCHLDTNIHRVSQVHGRRHIEFRQGGHERSVTVDQILVAMGRHPATEHLGLQHAHVGLAGRKIIVTPTMQTTQPHIFAAGDVCSPLDVVHVAIQQGEIAARNARRMLRGEPVSEEFDGRLRLFGVFSHPQVAAVGAGEVELRAEGVPFVSASYPFDDHGKSMVMGETEGFVKMIAHRDSGEILGACCVGPEATEIIHEVVVAMHHRCTVRQFMAIPHYHPTLSEIWTYPAEELAEQTGSGG